MRRVWYANVFNFLERHFASPPRACWVTCIVPYRQHGFHTLAARRPSSSRRQWIKDTASCTSSQSADYTSNSFSSPGTTIYALSTASGRAAIAVIRISGPACVQIYNHLCPTTALPQPRYAALRTLHEPHKAHSRDTILDSALVIYFPAPNTVTGEDVLELHVHGGPAIVKSVLAAIRRCQPTDSQRPAGALSRGLIRYAEPGEFTRRAFDNGRLDLVQIEALGDALTANTEQQRRLSVRGTTSHLARRYESWREQLLYARGELEALIDFSEDQHFDESPATLAASVARQVATLKMQIDHSVENAVRGELLRKGIEVALLGAPNVGKSSLLNRTVGREAAIVSQQEGTTRDVVEVAVDIGGFLVRLGDMAGVRKSEEHQATNHQSIMTSFANVVGEVEKEGIRRAKARALQSDVVIIVLSVEESSECQKTILRLDPEVIETAAQCVERGKKMVVVINKIDRIAKDDRTALFDAWTLAIQNALPSLRSDRIFRVSCIEAVAASAGSEANTSKSVGLQTQQTSQEAWPNQNDPGNIQSFLDGLIDVFEEMTCATLPEGGDVIPDPSMWEVSLGATERQRLLLEECAGQLDAFLGQVTTMSILEEECEGATAEDGIDIVVAAESLRAAADCLAKIMGKGEAGDVEEVLGVVFEKFCVGK